MTAITSLKSFKETAKNEPVTEDMTATMKALTDADVLSPEEVDEIKQVYSVFGAEYQGKSFEIYTSKNGEYVVTLPRIYSNGKSAVVNFGGTEVAIDGKQKVSKDARFRSGSKGSYLLYKKAGSFELPVFLIPDVAGAEKPTFVNAENVIDEDDVTWQEALSVLFGIYPRAKTEDLKFGFSLHQVDRIETKEDDGKTRAYHKAVVLTTGGDMYSCFLPDVEGVTFKVGDKISYDNVFKHDTTGKTFSIGVKFEKLANLASGEYSVVKVEESKGEFPGINFTLSDGRVISGNAKMKSWAQALASLSVVTGSNNAILTIGAKNTMKNGKTQVITFLKMRDASGSLMSNLLGKVGDRLKSAAPTTQLEVVSVIDNVKPAQLAKDDDPWSAIPV